MPWRGVSLPKRGSPPVKLCSHDNYLISFYFFVHSWAVFFNTPTNRSRSLPFHQHHCPSFHENLNTVEDIVQIIHAERREPDTPRQTGIQRILSETQTKKSRKKKEKISLNKKRRKKEGKKKGQFRLQYHGRCGGLTVN